jgi:glycosyltransferase involved in cell wall biosynthesis
VLSFVVPAHNEEALLPKTLASIKAAMVGIDDVHEVVVVDDASTDRTWEVAASTGARVVKVDVRQISAARNVGARVAAGDILVFVDADTTVSHQVIVAVRQSMKVGAVGGGCAVHFDGHVQLWAGILEAVARWGYRIVRMAAGCFLFCTRQAFMQVGGFDEGIFAGEEAVMSSRLKKVGRFVVLREQVITSGRKLRAYSGLEITCALGRLALLGRRGVVDRQRLDLWYGPRRQDPEAPGDGDPVASARDSAVP